MTGPPSWSRWNEDAAAAPWTVGVEEEVMLLDAVSLSLAPRIDEVLLHLDPELSGRVSAETHASALEIATGVRDTAADAAGELASLRSALSDTLAPMGMVPATAGTHPSATWQETVISPGARYRAIHGSMRELARREPTFALHVHVAVPTADMALRALNGIRAHLPVLLALAGNSPFWQGRDSGMASARTPLFGGFPRSGIPRRFADLPDYVETVDLLLRCGAFPEPTFLWWDVRLQPRFGTIEVRIMDAQCRVADVAALTALVQCIVRLEATEAFADPMLTGAQEVLDENRFLAARDGMAAHLLDPRAEVLRPAGMILGELVAACGRHADLLGCRRELDRVAVLAGDPGAARQRRLAGLLTPGPQEVGGAAGSDVVADLGPVLAGLADAYVAPGMDPMPTASLPSPGVRQRETAGLGLAPTSQG